MREISIIKKNILQYLDFKGVSKYEFYQKTGISNGILSQSNGISEDNILRFLSYYSEINADWLLTGKGEMLKENCIVHKVVDNEAIVYKELAEARLEIIALKDDKIAMLEKEIAELRYTVSSDPSLYINVAEPTPELIKTIKNLDK